MKIDKITLTNFRCYGSMPVEIPLESGLTTFVGNNGSGKTALFSALAKLFGINTAQRAITKRDFHIPLGATALTSGTTIAIDCVLSFPELETGDDDDDIAADDSAVPDFFHHMAASDEDAPLAVRMRLQATWTEDGTPEGTIEEEVRWIQTLGNDFDWLDCRKVQVVERSLIQLIYVPASRNAADQVTSLLKGRLWKAALWSNDLGDKATESAEQIQDQFDAEEPTKFITERLEKRWQEVHLGPSSTVLAEQAGNAMR